MNPDLVVKYFKKPGTRGMMCDLALHLRRSQTLNNSTTSNNFESLICNFINSKGLLLRDIAGPLRLALTNQESGFCLFKTCSILGLDLVCSRIVDSAHLMEP